MDAPEFPSVGVVAGMLTGSADPEMPSLETLLSQPMSEKARGKLGRIKAMLLTLKTIKKDDDR